MDVGTLGQTMLAHVTAGVHPTLYVLDALDLSHRLSEESVMFYATLPCTEGLEI